jgi:DNA polymerase-3 subunit beta
VGEARESLDCVSHGPEMELWFNPGYLLDALKSLAGDDVQLKFAGIQAPAAFRTRQEPNYFHIVLPLRQLV